jgi:hypothetical protein
MNADDPTTLSSSIARLESYSDRLSAFHVYQRGDAYITYECSSGGEVTQFFSLA